MDSNFFAPIAYEGVSNDQDDHTLVCYTPIFNSGSIAGGTEVQNLYLQLDNDAPFIDLHGIQFTDVQAQAGENFSWKIQIFDNEGQSITNGYVYGVVFGKNHWTVPFPIVPRRTVRGGGFLTFSIVALSVQPIDLQFALRCTKRSPK